MSLLMLAGCFLESYARRVARHYSAADKAAGSDQAQLSSITQQHLKAILGAAKELHWLSERRKDWSPRRVRKESYRVFMSHPVRVASVLCGGFENSRFRSKPLTHAAVEEMATRVSQLGSQNEAIVFAPQPKYPTGHRPTWRFGRVRYAQQIAFRWIVEALTDFNQFDHAQPTFRSIHSAAKDIGRALREGYRRWVTVDVASAHSSVRTGHLHQVCWIDKRLVDFIGFPVLPNTGDDATGANASSPVHSKTAEAKAAPRQLPQGGAHSSLVFSAITGEHLSLLKGEIVIVALADNIAIGAETFEEALSALKALQKALGELPAGPLLLHDLSLRDGYCHHGGLDAYDPAGESLPVWGGVDFCGYRISYDQADGEVRYRPSPEAWARLRRRIEHETLEKVAGLDEMYSSALAAAFGWRSSFKLWKDATDAIDLTVTLWIDDFLHGVSSQSKSGV